MAGEARRYPRAVGLEERFATLLPEVLIGLGLEEFAGLAAQGDGAQAGARGLARAHPRAHVSVREQAAVVVDRLRRQGTMTFRALSGDSPDTLTTVARFLALLELFREGVVAFDQVDPARRADASAGPAARTTTSRSPTSSTAASRADDAEASGDRDAGPPTTAEE